MDNDAAHAGRFGAVQGALAVNNQCDSILLQQLANFIDGGFDTLRLQRAGQLNDGRRLALALALLCADVGRLEQHSGQSHGATKGIWQLLIWPEGSRPMFKVICDTVKSFRGLLSW